MRFDQTIFDNLLTKFNLQGHVEGGKFSEISRSADTVSVDPARYLATQNHPAGIRAAYATIYFALPPNDFSAFHKLKSDERWTFIYGESATIYMLDPQSGELNSIVIGHPLDDHTPVFTVPKDIWFAIEPKENTGIVVVCDVSPGFEYQDFELADRERLRNEYSEHRSLITRLTRICPTEKKENRHANDASVVSRFHLLGVSLVPTVETDRRNPVEQQEMKLA